ncbi:MAG TPA: helix-turn-helix domain-containing protein [Myxococcota bacterium]
MHVIKDLPVVPAERAIKVIGGRWKVYILYFLFDAPRRFSELCRLIPDASQKVLVEHLRELEEHGIVHRDVVTDAHVGYVLTPLGQSLRPIVDMLCTWGRQHADAHGDVDRAACG